MAEKMIRLSGVEDIEVIETGLKPGERLCKELLVETEKLEILRVACEVEEDDGVREAMRKVVLTFRRPKEVSMETCGIVQMADGHRDENVHKKMVLACNLWSIDPGGI